MIEQTFIYKCDACGKREQGEPEKLYYGDTPYRPGIPLLWLYLDGRLYCNDHEVLLRIDGEPPQ